MENATYVVIAGGIFVLTLVGFILNSKNTYLSIREHETYSDFLRRELDVVRQSIIRLEDTRPTTGELEARFYRIHNQDNGHN